MPTDYKTAMRSPMLDVNSIRSILSGMGIAPAEANYQPSQTNDREFLQAEKEFEQSRAVNRQMGEIEQAMQESAQPVALPSFKREAMIGPLQRQAMQAGYAASAMGLDASGKSMGQEKLKNLAATERQELMDMETGVREGADILEKIDSGEYADVLGGGWFGQQAENAKQVMGYDSQFRKRRTAVDQQMKNLAARYMRAMTGKQMSDKERAYLLTMLPGVQDTANIARQKADYMTNFLRDERLARADAYRGAGYNVPEGKLPDARSAMNPAGQDTIVVAP